jgi:hypothetical protein
MPRFVIDVLLVVHHLAQIPWASLGHNPIVFVADTIFLELDEPTAIKPVKPLIFAYDF